MHWKWMSVAIMPALMALTLTVAGAPRATVADAPPLCSVEWPVLNGCPTSDATVAPHIDQVSPLLVKVPGL
jgi:hypothetical protein